MGLNVGNQPSDPYGTFKVGGTGTGSGSTNVGTVNGFSFGTKDTLGSSTLISGNGVIIVNSGRPDLPVPVAPPASLDGLTNFLTLPPPPPPSPDKTTDDEKAQSDQAQYEEDFNADLNLFAKQNNLSANDAAKLQFAFYNPNSAQLNSTLSNSSLGTIGSILAGLIATAKSDATKQGIDVSKLGTVDNKAFNLNISDSYGIAFEHAVNNSNFSEQEKATLIFLFYNPDFPVPKDNTELLSLQAEIPKIEEIAQQQIIQNLGVPPGYIPKKDSALYNHPLNGSFESNLQIELDDYASNHSLTKDQIEEIKNAIQDINNPKIPPAVLAIAKGILNAAITQTQVQNNLLVNWQPSSTELANVFNNIASSPITNSFVQARELLNSAVKQLQLLLPEGPEKKRVLDLLQSISQAIIKAQNTIYALEIANSQAARKETTAKLDLQQIQLKAQQAEQATTSQQSGKQQQLSEAMKYLGPIIEAVAIIAAIATGGLLGGIVGVVFIIVNTQFNAVSTIAHEVTKAVNNLISQIPANGDPNLERLQAALEGILEVVITTCLIIAFAAVHLPPSELLNTALSLFSDSAIVSDFCRMCGIPQEDVVWITLAITIAITLTIAIVSFCVDPGEAAAELPEVLEETGEIVAEVTPRVIEETGEILEETSTVISNATEEIEAAENLAEGAINALEEIEEVGDEVFEITQSTAKKILDAITDTLKNVIDSIKDQVRNSKAFQKLVELLEKLGQKIADNPKYASNALKAFNAGQTLLNAAGAGVQGGLYVSLAIVALAKAKYEPEIAELEAIIKNLEKVLNEILNNLSNLVEDLKNTTAVLDNTFASLESTLTNTTKILTT